ncbi:MAG TPA: hypothetical protein VGA69_01185 [Nitriliruptorales bacterium]
MPGDAELLIAARSALLDALDALKAHAANIVVIGAQAIHLRTNDIDLALAPLTKDADVAVDSRGLSGDPRVEDALSAAGFYPDPDNQQPGAWCSPSGLPVDVMVPEALAGPSASQRRGARLPPHANSSMRRAEGLEAVVIDRSPLSITALDANDSRVMTASVAGHAGLIVAKLHKFGERIGDPGRLKDKDAHDVYRLFVALPAPELAGVFRRLLDHDVSAAATEKALDYLRRDFTRADAVGATRAGRAEQGVGDPAQVREAVAAMATQLLATTVG